MEKNSRINSSRLSEDSLNSVQRGCIFFVMKPEKEGMTGKIKPGRKQAAQTKKYRNSAT